VFTNRDALIPAGAIESFLQSILTTNGTRQPVNISPKNRAMSVSIARIDAHTKSSIPDADVRVSITVSFRGTPKQAMTGIRKELAILIPHR
jgi:hypothetical protein